MADTTQTRDDRLKEIIAHLAMAANLSREAWLELEKALPKIRVAAPEFYEAFAHLLIGTYQSTQTIEDAGDDLVRDIMGVPAAREVPRLSGV